MTPSLVLFVAFTALGNAIVSILLAAGVPAEEISRHAVGVAILTVVPERVLWVGGIAAGMFLAGLVLFLATRPFDDIP